MMIKGVFTFLILFSHSHGYLFPSDSWTDSIYAMVQDHLGQLIVAMFFFYSGYGIWESFKNKEKYEKSFLSRRVLRLLLHFDIALVLYIIIQLFIPIVYPTRNYVLCWIGWESVGNSNWFIFVILCLYMIAWGAMTMQRCCGRGGTIFLILAAIALWMILQIVFHKESWWVDTLAAFPLGVIASSAKDNVFIVLKKRHLPIIVSTILLILFGVAHIFFGMDIYGGITCLFCCLVVALSSWIQIGNPVLEWAGENAFTIYIIQRLPMIIGSSLGLDQRPYLFLLFVIPISLLLAEGLSILYKLIDTRLFANA